MSKEVALLAVHGMGPTKTTFAQGFESRLSKKLGRDRARVHFDTIYYQSILQGNQDALFKRIKAKDEIDSIFLRKFLLFGFSDAAGMGRNAHLKGSPYEQAQRIILSVLDKAFDALGGAGPVVVVAYSLGAEVISNYIWDAQSLRPKQGIWRGTGPGKAGKGSQRDRFRRLKTLRFFYTTGCNIPIFVGGFPKDKIKAVATSSKGYSFRWKNFYDEDDALGWPLKHVSPSYGKAVFKDYPINAGQGLRGLLTSWNPLSHMNYWTDDDVIDPLVRDLGKLLK